MIIYFSFYIVVVYAQVKSLQPEQSQLIIAAAMAST
jgi:hypothetical protein